MEFYDRQSRLGGGKIQSGHDASVDSVDDSDSGRGVREFSDGLTCIERAFWISHSLSAE